MNAKVKSGYASWLSKQCNWNYKTFTRPYFNMQDAYIDQGLELVSKNKGVNGLFYCKEYDYDYKNVEPGSGTTHYCGAWMTDEEGTSKDPMIRYTVASGYGHGVNSVAAASIGKVNSLATANIGKINSLD